MVPKHVLNFPDLVQILENTCSENLQPHFKQDPKLLNICGVMR